MHNNSIDPGSQKKPPPASMPPAEPRPSGRPASPLRQAARAAADQSASASGIFTEAAAELQKGTAGLKPAGMKQASSDESQSSNQSKAVVDPEALFLSSTYVGAVIDTGQGPDYLLITEKDKLQDISFKSMMGLAERLGWSPLSLMSQSVSATSHTMPAEHSFIPFSPEEWGLVRAIEEAPFYATHATSVDVDKDGELTLFSRIELERRGIDFPKDHSSEEDLDTLANDGYVFFSLEVGLEPKKPSSKFGGILHKFDFSAPQFQNDGWLSLTDMIRETYPAASELPISNADKVVLGGPGQHGVFVGQEDHIFQGNDMKSGLAYSVIERIRMLSAEGQARLLACRSEQELNMLINNLFCPEIKVPGSLKMKPALSARIQYTPELLEQKQFADNL